MARKIASPIDESSGDFAVPIERHQIPVERAIETKMPNVEMPAVEAAVPNAAAPPTVNDNATEPAAIEAAAPPVANPPSAPPAADSAASAPPPPPEENGSTSVSSVAPPGSVGNVKIVSGDRGAMPEWAKQGGGIAPDGTYYMVVSSGPHLNFNSCWNELRSNVDSSVFSFRTWQLMGENFRPPNRTLPEHIRNQLMTDHFLEQGDSSVGETMTLYTRVAFTPEATAAVRAWQADLLANHRTLHAAILGGLIVGLIGVCYGYFRIDTATLGYYTWRLRFVAMFLGVGLTIAGIVAGVEFFDQEYRLGGINF
jgi:hypothetical protein